MHRVRLSPTVLLLVLATAAHAEGLNYNFIDIGWISTEIDVGGSVGDVDGDGFALEGSIAVAPRVHLFAAFETADFDFGIDVDSQSVGVGYNTPLVETIDFVAQGAIVRVDGSAGSFNDDDTGFGINIGLRGMATEHLEFNGFLTYIDIEDSETGISFAGIYYPSENWGFGATLGFADDTTTYGLGVRFYFRQ